MTFAVALVVSQVNSVTSNEEVKPEYMTNYSIATFDYNSSQSCCRLEFVKSDLKSALMNLDKFITVTDDTDTYFAILDESKLVIRKTEMEVSPINRLSTTWFLSNPNNCNYKWSDNFTDGMDGLMYVPTFDGKVLTYLDVGDENRFLQELNKILSRVTHIREFQHYPIDLTNIYKKESHSKYKWWKRRILFIQCSSASTIDILENSVG